MGRIIKEIEVGGKKAIALFDTGAWHSYIIKNLLGNFPVGKVTKPYKVTLGGIKIEIKENALIEGKIEGLDFNTTAIPIEEIGIVDGKEIDVIIGAFTMEEWEITLSPKTDDLGLEGLKRREFTEF